MLKVRKIDVSSESVSVIQHSFALLSIQALSCCMMLVQIVETSALSSPQVQILIFSRNILTATARGNV